MHGLLPAIVVGDRTGVTQPCWTTSSESGMDYLMAVGGLHFMVVCAARAVVAAPDRCRAAACAVVTGFVLLGFAEVAGGEPNVLRAALMVGVGLLALATGRARSAGSALAGTVVVLTLWQPAFAADVGFALSVVATGAMLLLAKPTAQALERHGVPAGIAELLAIALVAQLATAPVIAAALRPAQRAVGAGERAGGAGVRAGDAGGRVGHGVCSGVAVAGCCDRARRGAGVGMAAVRGAPDGTRCPASSISWPTGWWGGVALAAVLVAIVVALRYRRLRALMAAVLVGVFLVVVPVRCSRRDGRLPVGRWSTVTSARATVRCWRPVSRAGLSWSTRGRMRRRSTSA